MITTLRFRRGSAEDVQNAPSGSARLFLTDDLEFKFKDEQGTVHDVGTGGGTSAAPQVWNATNEQRLTNSIPGMEGGLEPLDIVRVTDQGGRIEQFMGDYFGYDTNWMVIQNSVNLTMIHSLWGQAPFTVNGQTTFNEGDNINLGWMPVGPIITVEGIGNVPRFHVYDPNQYRGGFYLSPVPSDADQAAGIIMISGSGSPWPFVGFKLSKDLPDRASINILLTTL